MPSVSGARTNVVRADRTAVHLVFSRANEPGGGKMPSFIDPELSSIT